MREQVSLNGQRGGQNLLHCFLLLGGHHKEVETLLRFDSGRKHGGIQCATIELPHRLDPKRSISLVFIIGFRGCLIRRQNC